ncbi:MAG TPA: hypothetical protein PLZ51_18095 [Aggregatilineales bacterium]|nr:hypothetical protein [Aggregatilineales bacterium]
MSQQSRNPILNPLSKEERDQIKTLFTFLAFIVTAVFIVGIIVSIVSNSWWG